MGVWGLKENDEMHKSPGGEGRGRSDLQRRLALHNEAIWWHKSVVSAAFLQAFALYQLHL